jgi:hypothetical protein
MSVCRDPRGRSKQCECESSNPGPDSDCKDQCHQASKQVEWDSRALSV